MHDFISRREGEKRPFTGIRVRTSVTSGRKNSDCLKYNSLYLPGYLPHSLLFSRRMAFIIPATNYGKKKVAR